MENRLQNHLEKMGHITVLDDDINVALEKANKAKDILKIKGSKKV